MPRADQADRRSGLRPVKCGATSKQSREQCRRWAIVGTVPPLCKIHGGNRRIVKDKAELAAVAAQMGMVGLEPADTIRIVQRVLSDQMLRAAGVLAAAAEEGRPVDPEEHQRFIDSSDRALVAARVALSTIVTEASDLREQDKQDAADLAAKAVGWAIDSVLGLVPELESEQRQALKIYALEMAGWAFAGCPDPRPVPPKMPSASRDSRPAVGELLPSPPRRAGREPADDVWRAVQEVVDAELVEQEDDDDGEEDDADAG
jgi:hypothetical protein